MLTLTKGHIRTRKYSTMTGMVALSACGFAVVLSHL